jgi:hypothetical protein
VLRAKELRNEVVAGPVAPCEKKVTGAILAASSRYAAGVGIDGTKGASGIANFACFEVFAAKRELPHGSSFMPGKISDGEAVHF